MNINSDIPFLECSKISMSENSPIIHVNTSMFNNTRLGHCRLLHQMLFRRSGCWAFRHINQCYSPQNISTLKYLPLAARYNWRQGPVPGRGPAVGKHCCRVRLAFAKPPGLNLCWENCVTRPLVQSRQCEQSFEVSWRFVLLTAVTNPAATQSGTRRSREQTAVNFWSSSFHATKNQHDAR
jgi:hypothetical protein